MATGGRECDDNSGGWGFPLGFPASALLVLSPGTGHPTLLSELRSTLGPQLTFGRLCLLQYIKEEKIHPKVDHIKEALYDKMN